MKKILLHYDYIILLWERPTDERIQKDGLIARHVMGTMRSLADCQQTVDISVFSEILLPIGNAVFNLPLASMSLYSKEKSHLSSLHLCMTPEMAL